jgi:predicted small metal-binding protein
LEVRFACAWIGADTCDWAPVADSQEEMLRKVAEHLATVHRVKAPTQTILTFVAKHTRITD